MNKEQKEEAISDLIEKKQKEKALETWRATDHKQLTHFFGEMDLDLSKPKEEIYIVAFYISEACGYFVSEWKNFVELTGREGEYYKIVFDGDKATAIMLGQVNEVKEMDDKVLIPLSPMDERSTHFFATIISDLVKLGYEQKDIERHYKDFLKANKLKDILAYVEDRGRMIWQGERTTIVVG